MSQKYHSIVHTIPYSTYYVLYCTDTVLYCSNREAPADTAAEAQTTGAPWSLSIPIQDCRVNPSPSHLTAQQQRGPPYFVLYVLCTIVGAMYHVLYVHTLRRAHY